MSRGTAAQPQVRATSRPPWLVPAIGGAIVLVAAVVAIILTSGGSTGGSSARPSSLPSASVAAGAAPTISGTPLEPLAAGETDPAVGQVIPTVTTPDGSIAVDGRPKVILFVAHWCPHCQAEVPRIQAWIDGGGLPSDVDFVTVSTGIDPTLPNYPPEAWFERVGWTPRVVSDSTNEIATAFGLPSYPYLVFVNADGTVAGRAAGEVPVEQIQQAIGALQR